MNDMTKTKISALKDGAEFYRSKKTKVLYRLDTFEKGGIAVISAKISNRTYRVPKRTVIYLVS
jgi:hypothetical protein